ncbi:sigma factor-like helix-turn-helix DNA-binding protein [Thiomicrospira sp. ALE5]|uniref:sigma factor-like helix-turn-helix DNA-binding protein n=1 Tax=Thiomicrospira sp. ALE5 TaxID=748650 RepID=UPI000B839D16
MREFTCKEIGAQLGISPDRVRQIQNEAILKCKIYCQQRGLELSDILAVKNPQNDLKRYALGVHPDS